MKDIKLQILLRKIYEKITKCGDKMVSATKFLDFFVHDMLDYTILNKDDQNFIKNITVANIKVVLNELLEMMIDKVQMKNIHIQTKFVGF